MPALKVHVRRYRAEELRVGGVVLGVLRLESESHEETTGDPLDVLLSKAEDAARARGAETSYYEVIVETDDVRRALGEGPRYGWGKRLTFKPERLLRVGVVRRSILKPITAPAPQSPVEEPAEGDQVEEVESGEEPLVQAGEGAYVFRLDEVEWYEVDDKLYVYEGTLVTADTGAAGDIVFVVLETETGRRYVKPSPVLRRSRSSRTRRSRGRRASKRGS